MGDWRCKLDHVHAIYHAETRNDSVRHGIEQAQRAADCHYLLATYQFFSAVVDGNWIQLPLDPQDGKVEYGIVFYHLIGLVDLIILFNPHGIMPAAGRYVVIRKNIAIPANHNAGSAANRLALRVMDHNHNDRRRKLRQLLIRKLLPCGIPSDRLLARARLPDSRWL